MEASTSPQASTIEGVDLGQICPTCSCDTGSYLVSASFPVGSIEELLQPINNKPLNEQDATRVGRTFFHRIVLDNLLNALYTNADIVVKLWQNALSCPDAIFAYNLQSLKPRTPTMYLFTRTGPGGRLGKVRGKYFGRHIEAITEYTTLVSEHGYVDGVAGSERQLVWIVMEDDAALPEDGLREILATSGINYIFLAHGPTRFVVSQSRLSYSLC